MIKPPPYPSLGGFDRILGDGLPIDQLRVPGERNADDDHDNANHSEDQAVFYGSPPSSDNTPYGLIASL